MYLQDYFWFLGAIFICMIFSIFASAKINFAFKKGNKTTCSSSLTGYDTAVRLLRANGITDVSVQRVSGKLTDHYHPKKGLLCLSQSTYGNDSVAAVAVAAHEVGHVVQRQKGYFWYGLRTVLVPIVNIGTRIALPLVLLGFLMDIFASSADSQTGFYVAMAGVILYGGSLVFALVTLPVEINASNRAQKMLLEQGILSTEEISCAKEVLSAAALTYLASALTSLVYFLRFLLMVLTVFGKRKR